jgi:hypothetical protein
VGCDRFAWKYMVRRGSTVRVRQRALEKASKWPFFVALTHYGYVPTRP